MLAPLAAEVDEPAIPTPKSRGTRSRPRSSSINKRSTLVVAEVVETLFSINDLLLSRQMGFPRLGSRLSLFLLAVEVRERAIVARKPVDKRSAILVAEVLKVAFVYGVFFGRPMGFPRLGSRLNLLLLANAEHRRVEIRGLEIAIHEGSSIYIGHVFAPRDRGLLARKSLPGLGFSRHNDGNNDRKAFIVAGVK